MKVKCSYPKKTGYYHSSSEIHLSHRRTGWISLHFNPGEVLGYNCSLSNYTHFLFFFFTVNWTNGLWNPALFVLPLYYCYIWTYLSRNSWLDSWLSTPVVNRRSHMTGFFHGNRKWIIGHGTEIRIVWGAHIKSSCNIYLAFSAFQEQKTGVSPVQAHSL